MQASDVTGHFVFTNSCSVTVRGLWYSKMHHILKSSKLRQNHKWVNFPTKNFFIKPCLRYSAGHMMNK